MLIIDGKEPARIEKEKLREELKNASIRPGLAVVIVGDDPSSHIYVNSKEKACKDLGYYSVIHRLGVNTTEAELLELIHTLNHDREVSGILVQMPLPEHIREEAVIDTILPSKDVDCFHPYNFGRLLAGNQLVEPCTPRGVMHLLDTYKLDVKGKHAVVIGRSNIVGKPTAMLLLQRHATVTIAHSRTADLAAMTRQADVLVTAIGKPDFVTAEMVKPGAIVLDVGINRIEDSSEKGYHLTGDVDYKSVSQVASALTPVPGGVGALTVIMLMRNTFKMAQLQERGVV